MNQLVGYEAIPSKNHSFVRYWDVLTKEQTQPIVDYFESHPGKHAGLFGFNKVDSRLKESIDLTIVLDSIPDVLEPALNGLQCCLVDYLDAFAFCNNAEPFGLVESINIQKYEPGWAYWAAHSERQTISTSHRYLVWMIYLNDVEDGGETHFEYQDVGISPKAGRVVIWPTDWTHTHRGLPSKTGSKYIMTGWYGFFSPNYG